MNEIFVDINPMFTFQLPNINIKNNFANFLRYSNSIRKIDLELYETENLCT